MPADILQMPARIDESWLAAETLTAYYIALSVQPEIAQAPAVVRAALVDRVVAGMRASLKLDDHLDAQGRAQCIALMRQDAAATAERQMREGW